MQTGGRAVRPASETVRHAVARAAATPHVHSGAGGHGVPAAGQVHRDQRQCAGQDDFLPRGDMQRDQAVRDRRGDGVAARLHARALGLQAAVDVRGRAEEEQDARELGRPERPVEAAQRHCVRLDRHRRAGTASFLLVQQARQKGEIR